MRKLIVSLLCAGAVLAPFATAGASTPTVDQSQTQTGYGAAMPAGEELAQTFTPSVSGPLTQVQLLVGPTAGSCMIPSFVLPATDLIVSIRATDSAGAPLDASLATTEVPPSAVPVDATGANQPLTVTFATPPVLTAGAHYAITLSVVAPDVTGCAMAFPGVWNVAGNAVDPGGLYPGGMVWGRTFGNPFSPSSSWDLWFKTFAVAAVPSSKDDCKNGGWATFSSPTFKNQGECVAYTNHH